MFSCDFSQCGAQPKYVYLYEQMKSAILDGRLEAGQRLPSKRVLARDLDIAVNTVANAYAMLETEGYIAARQRSGYYVEEVSEGLSDALPTGAPKNIANLKPSEASKEQPCGGAASAESAPIADFKANRTSLRLFPKTTWNQLMRKSLLEGDKTLETVPFNGLLELRQAIVAYLANNRGIQASPEQVVVGAGTEYLYLRLAQLLGHSTVFGFEDPGYKQIARIPQSMGNLSRFIPIDDAGVRIDALQESDVDVVHVSPANHFPTGIVMPARRRYELLDWANVASKRYIIEDDYDSEFRYRGKYIPPLFTQDTQHKVIYMNTFSKTLVPSLRISYMVLPPRLMERYIESMNFYSCTVSSFEQLTLAQFIAKGHFERHVNRLRTYYKKLRLAILDEYAASRLSKVSQVIENNAGTHFLLYVRTTMTEKDVRKKALAARVQVHFLSEYFEKPPAELYANGVCMVVNYGGVDPNQVPEAVESLCRLFDI